jgi:hypothetical protein
MPISPFNRLGLGVLCALVMAAFFTSISSASASVGVDLRVVNTEGRALAQLRQYTDTTQIRTDPAADCFGPGSGGSGAAVAVNGPTALGVVDDAAATQDLIRPVSVTDHFGFGLGICGFGGFRSDSGRFWYLKVDHKESSVGGDQVPVFGGTDVIWYLIQTSSCPPPDYFCVVSDLQLNAPPRATPGSQITVHADAYSRTGVKTPAQGVLVSGAGVAPALTDSAGNASVQVGSPGTHYLFGSRGADIPSQLVSLCVAERLKACPAHRGMTIAGSDLGDRINGSDGTDKIIARGGDDDINARGGGRDSVGCGPGVDKVKVDRRDKAARSCEQIRGAAKKEKGKKKR